MKTSVNSRYFLTLSYIFMLVYKVFLAGQYLYSVPNHHPILFFPPFSLALAATDFILLFIFFKVCDFFSKFKYLNLVYLLLPVGFGAFLLYDFAIVQYFRGFDNYGLSNFMAFDLIADAVAYFLFSLNSFLNFMILFWLFLVVSAFLFVFKRKIYFIKPFSDRVIPILLVVNIILFSVLRCIL